MNSDLLDNDELLHLALDAINNDRNPEALTTLRTLLERDPKHVFANYLLAAQHAQLGMMERAEEGFRRTVDLAPDFPMARLQFGQILMVKGDAAAAKDVLAPLTTLPAGNALGGYSRGLSAAASENVPDAIREIRAGLACEQDIPALQQDMQRVLDNLLALPQAQGLDDGPSASAPLFLTGYGKSQD